MALSIRHILSATFSPGKRTIVKREYDKFYHTIGIRLRHIARDLPYPNNYKSKFFVVHLQIESSKVKNFYYDTVVQFLTDTHPTYDTMIRCYCNSPSFAFFFAWVYNRWDALIFKQYYDVRFLTIPPNERNKKKIPEADKYIYTAIRYCFFKRLDYNSVDKFGMTDWNVHPVKPFAEALSLRNVIKNPPKPRAKHERI